MTQECTEWDVDYAGYGGDNSLRFCKVTAPSTETFNSLGMNAETATGNVKLAIYTNQSLAGLDQPDALVGYTNSTAVVAGEHAYAMTEGHELTSGTDYWVGFILSEQAGAKKKTNALSGDPAMMYYSHTYADPFPSTLSGPGTSATGLQVCIDTSGTPVPPPSSDGLLNPPPVAWVNI